MYQYTKYFLNAIIVLLFLSIFVVFVNLYASKVSNRESFDNAVHEQEIAPSVENNDYTQEQEANYFDDDYKPKVYVYEEPQQPQNIPQNPNDNPSDDLNKTNKIQTLDDLKPINDNANVIEENFDASKTQQVDDEEYVEDDYSSDEKY